MALASQYSTFSSTPSWARLTRARQGGWARMREEGAGGILPPAANPVRRRFRQ